ncbi:MAG: polysaccharide biosynthesis/export family protein [Candidatus Binatus sp.]
MDNEIANKMNWRVSLCGVLLLFASGCATSVTPNPSQTDPPAASSPIPAPAEPAMGSQFQDEDSAALERLWRARLLDSSDNPSSGSFVLGPGDLLRISVPPIAQLTDRTVRVSEQDTIALPLLGEINVAGMTEKDLRAAVAVRMEKYMYHPQVEVFLDQAEDRQVAVLGAVKTPGRYMLTSRSDTVMTMIGRAGGITEGAASLILLTPAPIEDLHSRAAAPMVQVASAGSPMVMPISAGAEAAETRIAVANEAAGPSSELDPLGGGQLVIDMSQASQRYLQIPARPGDVVRVPLAGEVTVQGWVEKPGSFKVTTGMTVLNAIAAAGGPQFTSSATLLREKPNRGKQSLALDLSKMKSGEQPDLPVEGGDVIVVERSVVGALPYSLYLLISHIGIGLPIF